MLVAGVVGGRAERGHDAGHVAQTGRAGTKDWYLVPFIVENDLIFVSNNARDFRRLYAELDLHPGLVLILPKVSRERQKTLFGLALDAIERRRDIINMLVEVDADGTVSFQDWPGPKREG